MTPALGKPHGPQHTQWHMHQEVKWRSAGPEPLDCHGFIIERLLYWFLQFVHAPREATPPAPIFLTLYSGNLKTNQSKS